MLLSREHLGFDIVSIFVHPRFSDITLQIFSSMEIDEKLHICQVFIYIYIFHGGDSIESAIFHQF